MNSSKRNPAICLGALWLVSAAWAQVVVPKGHTPPPAVAQAAKRKHAAPAAAKAATAKSAAAKPSAKGGAKSAAAAKSKAAPQKAQAASGRTAPEEMDGKRPRVVHRVRRAAKPPRKVERKDVGKHGERDPFVSPVVERGRVQVSCTGTGRQCLEVSDLTLQGVVKGPSGFIAVVANGEHTYFLRERDPLANGDVEQITRDSIHLRERYQDELGRPQTRQVVRKILVPAV